MKASVSISRSSDNNVRIRIRDEASRVEFAVITLTVEAFGYAVTGLSEQLGDLEVRGLEFIGRKKVIEKRQIVCPIGTYKKEELSAWLRENAKEDGWIINDYLWSQDSVSRGSGGTLLRYNVIKYVDAA